MVQWGKPKIISASQLYFSLKMYTVDTLVILIMLGFPWLGARAGCSDLLTQVFESSG